MPRIISAATALLAVLTGAPLLAACSSDDTRSFDVQRGAQGATTAPPPLSVPPILTERAGPGVGHPADTDDGTVPPEQAAPAARADTKFSDAVLFGPLAARPADQPPLIQREAKSWMSSVF